MLQFAMSEISELHDNNNVLSCTEYPLKALLDSAYFAIVSTDTNGYIVYMNDIAVSVLDLDLNESKSPIHMSEINPDAWIDFKKIMETGESQIAVPVITDKFSFLVNRTPIFWDGRIAGVVSVFQYRKEYEKTLEHLSRYQELVREVEAIIASSYDGLYVTDGDANTIRVNQAYENMTGIKASEVIGRNMKDLVKEGYFSESATLKVLEEQKTVTLCQKLKSGKHILVTGNPSFDDEGRIKMVVTNVRDMTDLKELNQKLAGSLEMTRIYKDQLKELQLSSYKDNEIVKTSKAMRTVYNLVERVSKIDATVLLQGETGVGKDRIAEEIHAKSDRAAKGLFVKINCGAIPETLLESELFGYKKGAFTGASKEGKPGLFEVADKGTLFLDEVENMPLSLQGKLLRVLQDFEITRLGGVIPKKVDVRLICASNQDLIELVKKKIFRSDLYYRLNVIPVYIPPLRERTEDIPHLLTIFLDRFNRQYSRKKVFSNRAIDKLIHYSWPGNVREMLNMIERLVVIVTGNRIEVSELPHEVYQVQEYENICQDTTLKEHLERMRITIIRDAINKYGNARKAAFHLGVNPSTLTRAIKKT